MQEEKKTEITAENNRFDKKNWSVIGAVTTCISLLDLDSI